MFWNVDNVGAERMSSGRLFQATGPATQNARLPSCSLKYLADCRVPVSEVSGRQHLRSASRRKLNIPRFRHMAPAGFLGRRSDGLELTAGFVA